MAKLALAYSAPGNHWARPTDGEKVARYQQARLRALSRQLESTRDQMADLDADVSDRVSRDIECAMDAVTTAMAHLALALVANEEPPSSS